MVQATVTASRKCLKAINSQGCLLLPNLFYYCALEERILSKPAVLGNPVNKHPTEASVK